jgi:glycosyltransferase involved in cell wall biosynthesis
MKIGYLVNTYPAPSHSFIRREIQALEKQGFEIHRFAMRDTRNSLVDPSDIDEYSKTEYVLHSSKLSLIAGAFKTMLTQPGDAAKALVQAISSGRKSDMGVLRHLIYFIEATHVAAQCKTRKIEHLHAHFGTNSAAVAMLAKILGGANYSFTVHGPEEFDKPKGIDLGQKIRHSQFTVAVSSFGRSQLSRWVDYDHWSKLHVVHCGIEPNLFAEPKPLPAGDIRMVAIGRLVEQKGQLLLIEALSSVVAAHPNLHLTLVGDGEMRGEIEAGIKSRGLEKNVTITGWVDEARVRQELADAHALIMPSFAEGLPMVIMEAMAAARPVVATYIAGIPELVQSGVNGWLVPAGDANSLADAMLQLGETSPDDLQAMGDANRARVLQRHDVDVEAKKLGELILASVGQPAAQPFVAQETAKL